MLQLIAQKHAGGIKMKKRISLFAAAVLVLICAGCGSQQEQAVPTVAESAEEKAASSAPLEENDERQQPHSSNSTSSDDLSAEESEGKKEKMENVLRLYINEKEVPVIWEENESTAALITLAEEPLTVQMAMYGGFEQVGSLGTALPRDDIQTTTQAGDIVLYSGSQIVIFYGSNSWAYTRLGRITDLSAEDMKELLGNGNVTVTIALK